MTQDTRKRHVVSFEKMSDELAAVFNEKYPGGRNDYFNDIKQYHKPDGTPFHAVTIETPDDIYLVKVVVKTDDLEDIERWLQGEEDAENEQVAGASADTGSDSDTLPDDNIAQYGSDEESAEP